MLTEQDMLRMYKQLDEKKWGLVSAGPLEKSRHFKYRGKLRDFDVYLTVNEEWVYLQCPLLEAVRIEDNKPALYDYLLKANDRMFFAKFTLYRTRMSHDPTERIALTVECPLAGFNASMFRLMTEAVSTYAEHHHLELGVIESDVRVASLLSADRDR